jgi:hypothetical protein
VQQVKCLIDVVEVHVVSDVLVKQGLTRHVLIHKLRDLGVHNKGGGGGKHEWLR